MDVGDDEYTCDPHDILSQIGECGRYNVIEPLVDEQSNDQGSDRKSVVEKPYLNQEFDDLDDVYTFYNCYALQEGFGIRRSSSSKSSVTGELIWKKFLCDKTGWRAKNKEKEDGSEVVSQSREKRDGCMASLNVHWKKHGTWVVMGFVEEHSHTLDTPRRTKKHRSHNVSHKMSAAKDLMEQLHSFGIGPSVIAKAINTTGNITEITTGHVVHHLRKQRMNNVGQERYLVAIHFMEQMRLDPNFYFATEYGSDGTLL
ncbi:FAR1 domain-containing protein [Cephalotus follicularis]|uniref:FAR1 domain-containing protein n=1 Tax=Cephalotus follicularis TaxID=3775 RepID=A0A1Q3DFQ5_CEPFO|nr:FAR1 domain-containing protein [Cephalotus follicularis]